MVLKSEPCDHNIMVLKSEPSEHTNSALVLGSFIILIIKRPMKPKLLSKALNKGFHQQKKSDDMEKEVTSLLAGSVPYSLQIPKTTGMLQHFSWIKPRGLLCPA